MIPAVRQPSSAIITSCPGESSRRGCSARDSGTNRCVSAIAIRPTGTLIQKIERHPIPLTSRPPSTGPLARLSPATDPHRPIAFARPARSVNVLAMIDIATGLSIDPPTACSPRKAISHPSDGARLHSNDPSEKAPSPI